MCGRFKPKASWNEWHEVLESFTIEEPAQGEFNFDREEIFPTNRYPVIRLDADGKPEVVKMRWSLIPFWVRGAEKDWKATSFNTKIETAADAKTWRVPIRRKHCLTSVDLFYEWWPDEIGGKSIRHDVRRADNHDIVFACVWDSTTLDDGQKLESFSIVTREAGIDMKGVHTREPVVLKPDEYEAWLKCEPVDSIGPLEGPWPSAPEGTFRLGPTMFIEPIREPKPAKPKAKKAASDETPAGGDQPLLF